MNIQQKQGANPRVSAWVSANAGTGKTKVLADRALRLLLAGAEPSRVLCLTYTNAAAAEMRERIRSEMARWVMLPDTALAAVLADLTDEKPDETLLQRARALFAGVLDAQPGLRIETLHAFCQSVLRRFPLEAGVSPHFTVIDERTASELVREAQARLLGGSANEALLALSARMAEQSIGDLLTMLIGERRKLEPLLARENGLERLIDDIWKELGLKRGMTPDDLVGAHRYAGDKAELMTAARVLCEAEHDPTRTRGEDLVRWLEGGPVDDYLGALLTQKGTKLQTLMLKEMREKHPHIEEVLRREQERALALSQKRCALAIAATSEQVARVADALLAAYRRLKDDRAFLDYDDLVLRTLAMLRRPGLSAWVLFKLDGGLDHLLVDEAQDTSPQQWEMLRILSEELFSGEGRREAARTVFVVGDEKQSIYSFQGAAPRQFDDMQRWFRQRIGNAQQPYEYIPLQLSYRSTEPILALVDRVFASPETRAGLVFTQADVHHEAHRRGEPGLVELWEAAEAKTIRNPNAWEQAAGGAPEETSPGLLAQRMADTIAGWLKEKRMLPAKGRPVRPGDILVLVRRRRGAFVGALARALRRAQIPVAGLDRLVLTQHIGVRDLIALGEFLLLPQDDLNLAIVLRSPLGGISDAELFELAHGRGNASLWQRLQADDRFKNMREFLADLLAHADAVPPYELYARALDTLGGRTRMAARLGAEVHELLDEFLLQAMRYEETHPPSLQGFIRWVGASQEQIKRDMEQGADAVRIMTVHGAKGLQAPIVFLPDTMRAPRFQEQHYWSEGESCLFFAPASAGDDEVVAALRARSRTAMFEEYRRLLYVALTRAEDELYICGWKGKQEDKGIASESWYALVECAVIPHAAVVEEGWKRWRIEKTGTAKTAQAKADSKAAVGNPPAHLLTPAPAETLPRKVTPSGLEASAPSAPGASGGRQRGVLVHKLLELLPEIPADRQAEAARHWLERSLPKEEAVALAKEVVAVLRHPDFAHAFGPGSKAEVPVVGNVTLDGQSVMVSGQIDRLLVTQDGVWIIDYKTDRHVPADETAGSAAYRRQLALYRALLMRIYPGKPVRAALLWTAAPKLMEISLP